MEKFYVISHSDNLDEEPQQSRFYFGQDYPCIDKFTFYLFNSPGEIKVISWRDRNLLYGSLLHYTYVVGIGTSKFSVEDIAGITYLIPDLQKIKNYLPDHYYYFFWNRQNRVLEEKLSDHPLICGYQLNHQRISVPVVCCHKNVHYYFIDYLNSIREKKFWAYLFVDDLDLYPYDPLNIYLFCGNHDKLHGIKCYVINTEQLSVHLELLKIKQTFINKIPLIEYSMGNIKLINLSASYLPYQLTSEITRLRDLIRHTEKIYDGALCGTLTSRRQYIVLKLKNYKICYVTGWGDERDKKISQSRILINVHQSSQHRMYEPFRCDRWALAGMPVLSESSYDENILDIRRLVTFSPYDKLVENFGSMIKNLPVINLNEADEIGRQRYQTFLENYPLEK